MIVGFLLVVAALVIPPGTDTATSRLDEINQSMRELEQKSMIDSLNAFGSEQLIDAPTPQTKYTYQQLREMRDRQLAVAAAFGLVSIMYGKWWLPVSVTFFVCAVATWKRQTDHT
jgi:hypothetical protein